MSSYHIMYLLKIFNHKLYKVLYNENQKMHKTNYLVNNYCVKQLFVPSIIYIFLKHLKYSNNQVMQ